MKAVTIINYLDQLIPNPKCELTYQKDYELLIKVMLSAQTTDKRVNNVSEILFTRYPSLKALKEAQIDKIEEIIRPIGTFHKKALNIQNIAKELIDNYNGKVPNNRTSLESLPGIGRKSANVVMSNLFNEPCIAVDTHVSRVSIRLGIAKQNDNPLIIEKKLNQFFPKDHLARLHHQLVLFGRYYCKAIKPDCSNCGLKNICHYILEKVK